MTEPLASRIPPWRRRPTLTVAIMSRDGAARLPLLLGEARLYADEILVAVDAATTDDTLAVARAGADRVFTFTHSGAPSAARLASVERARGDWILFLDDDEGMDAAFPELRDELLGTPGVTHWALPRKWVQELDADGRSGRWLQTDPWWPDRPVRLARADRTRIWKPPAIHTGILVSGRGAGEARTAILHYERVDRVGAERAAKLARHHERGQDAAADAYYAEHDGTGLVPIDPAPLRGHGVPAPSGHAAVVDPEPEDLDRRPALPGWAADVDVAMPRTARAGQQLGATARARNTGSLRWDTPDPTAWPALAFSYRLHAADGTLLDAPGERTPIGREVAPGERVDLVCRLVAPAEPGEYLLAWQLLSEGAYWFTELGSTPAWCPLTVTAG